MGKILAIYGAGGLGREILELAKIINATSKRWDDFIFAEVQVEEGQTVNGIKVYDENKIKDEFGEDIEVVIGVGEPAIRKKLFNKVKMEGFTLAILIHPDVHIPDTTKIGEGVVIQMGCFISCNVTIGDYVYIHPHVNVGHDSVLEEGCVIAGFGNIAGAVHIGKYSYLALNTCIKQLLKIGDNCIIGMGSVVFKDVENDMIVLGNPARVVSRNEKQRVF